MRKQFDIIVYPTEEIEPPILDPALEWFASNNINDTFPKTTAEWILILHKDIGISSVHLNEIAKACLDLPMIDCFAPSLSLSTNDSPFSSGFLIDKKKGPITIEKVKSCPFEYVAAPSPYLMVVSRRIIQRTGAFDLDLSPVLRFIDIGLRMYHAGGEVFAIPLSPVTLNSSTDVNSFLSIKKNEYALTLFKNLGLNASLLYLKNNFSIKAIFSFFKNLRSYHHKRKKAISLSKFSEERLQKIYQTF